MHANRTVVEVDDSMTSALMTFNETSDAPYELNISYGSAPFMIEEGVESDLSALMVEADSRLYHMKRKKKGLL